MTSQKGRPMNCVKTTSPPPALAARNIVVRRCVIWNDRAYALGVTYETRCDVTNVLFADCDVIHDLGIASLAAHVSDSGTVSSLRFENIRLEDVKHRAVRLWIGKDMWGHDSERGHQGRHHGRDQSEYRHGWAPGVVPRASRAEPTCSLSSSSQARMTSGSSRSLANVVSCEMDFASCSGSTGRSSMPCDSSHK